MLTFVPLILTWLVGVTSTATASSGKSDSLAWVAPVSRRITSNFCELRGKRYHAGIDISTNGTVGHPILAPVDGYVSRISANFWGYGKHLVVTGDNGRSYLFGHLLEFRDDLEVELLRHQQEAGSYIQSIVPDAERFRVTRGQQIALSGDTGSGPPHLHFEVRQGEGWVLNPLTNGVVAPDHKAPLFQELALIPAAPGVRVLGSQLPTVVGLRQGSHGWEAERKLVVSGPVKLALRAIDKVDFSDNRLAPYRIRLLVEQDTLYDAVFEEFPFALNHQVIGEINRWLRVERKETFRNLWPTPGELPFARPLRPLLASPVPIAREPESDGVIHWEDRNGADSLALRLELEDTAANRSVMSLVLHHLPQREPESRAVSLPDTLVEGTAWKSAVFHWERDWASLRLPVATADSLLLMSDRGCTLWPLSSSPGKQSVEGSFRFDPASRWLQLAWRKKDGLWQAGPLWNLAAVQRGEAGLLSLTGKLGNTLKLGWEKDSFQAAQPLLVEDRGGDWLLGPADLELVESLVFSVSLPDWVGPDLPREKLALYRSENQDLSWIGHDSTPSGLSGTVTWPGRYTVAADTTAPRISLAGDWKQKAGSRPLIQFATRDERSGIQDVRMWLNGVRVFARYDPEGGRVLYRPRGSLAAGPQKVRLQVSDACGNESEWNGSFVVH